MNARDPLHVIVVGAGVVGMATALVLSDRGHRVTVIDAAGEPGCGCSFANGAQLSYAYTDALASPATLAAFPRLWLARDPAFRFHPGLDRDFLRWSLAFLRSGSARPFPPQHARGAGAGARIAAGASRAGRTASPRLRAPGAGQDHSLPLGEEFRRGTRHRRRQDRGRSGFALRRR
ncbi:FAD-dependent oxidoreductase [Sphingopyxis sp. PET50]|uniref:FAD-dependent oxidoreductase n=1 Tax=Sphingopyxis sp. PET50 TaxID=2976533 RepID=UPI00391A5356